MRNGRHPRLRLRRERRAGGTTLEGLRDVLFNSYGVDTSLGYLSDIERGAREPRDLDMVIAFESIFGIPAESWPNFRGLSRFLELRKEAS